MATTAIASLSARPHLRAQAFRPNTAAAFSARLALHGRPGARASRRRGSLQVVAVRVENEEVALGTVAPDFEVCLCPISVNL